MPRAAQVSATAPPYLYSEVPESSNRHASQLAKASPLATKLLYPVPKDVGVPRKVRPLNYLRTKSSSAGWHRSCFSSRCHRGWPSAYPRCGDARGSDAQIRSLNARRHSAVHRLTNSGTRSGRIDEQETRTALLLICSLRYLARLRICLQWRNT